MDRKAWYVRPVVWAGAVVAIGAGALLFSMFFAPQGTTTMAETLDMDAPGLTTLASGTWDGDVGHRSEGTVTLLEDADGAFLFFEDFEQSSGPDVFLYLSSDAEGRFRDGDVWKVPVPGGADGQTTVRGDFRVPIPASVPLDRVASAITWCDRFAVQFGHAVLA